MISLSYAFLAVSLLNSLHDFHVSSCDKSCADKPVFTPSRLVVKYGDPTSASCLACEQDCPNELYNIENSVGETTKNGTTISWEVDSLTEWDIDNMLCYNTDDDSNQCCSKLPITVYQPPTNVSFSFLNHTGPMFVGHEYKLQCNVQEVAPVGNVNVTFYRGQTELGSLQSNNREITPVTETFTLDINPSREEDGEQYWCEAKLDLGAEGPQPPPVMVSEKLMSTVHYKPQLKVSSDPEPITLTKGDRLELDCSAVGNPRPSYDWTFPSASGSPFNGEILTIESVTLEDNGQYTCSVHNDIGTVTRTFNVDVKVNYTLIILAVVLSVLMLVTTIFIVGFVLLYKQSRKGRYNVKSSAHEGAKHIAVPMQEYVRC